MKKLMTILFSILIVLTSIFVGPTKAEAEGEVYPDAGYFTVDYGGGFSQVVLTDYFMIDEQPTFDFFGRGSSSVIDRLCDGNNTIYYFIGDNRSNDHQITFTKGQDGQGNTQAVSDFFSYEGTTQKYRLVISQTNPQGPNVSRAIVTYGDSKKLILSNAGGGNTQSTFVFSCSASAEDIATLIDSSNKYIYINGDEGNGFPITFVSDGENGAVASFDWMTDRPECSYTIKVTKAVPLPDGFNAYISNEGDIVLEAAQEAFDLGYNFISIWLIDELGNSIYIPETYLQYNKQNGATRSVTFTSYNQKRFLYDFGPEGIRTMLINGDEYSISFEYSDQINYQNATLPLGKLTGANENPTAGMFNVRYNDDTKRLYIDFPSAELASDFLTPNNDNQIMNYLRIEGMDYNIISDPDVPNDQQSFVKVNDTTVALKRDVLYSVGKENIVCYVKAKGYTESEAYQVKITDIEPLPENLTVEYDEQTKRLTISANCTADYLDGAIVRLTDNSREYTNLSYTFTGAIRKDLEDPFNEKTRTAVLDLSDMTELFNGDYDLSIVSGDYYEIYRYPEKLNISFGTPYKEISVDDKSVDYNGEYYVSLTMPSIDSASNLTNLRIQSFGSRDFYRVEFQDVSGIGQIIKLGKEIQIPSSLLVDESRQQDKNFPNGLYEIWAVSNYVKKDTGDNELYSAYVDQSLVNVYLSRINAYISSPVLINAYRSGTTYKEIANDLPAGWDWAYDEGNDFTPKTRIDPRGGNDRNAIYMIDADDVRYQYIYGLSDTTDPTLESELQRLNLSMDNGKLFAVRKVTVRVDQNWESVGDDDEIVYIDASNAYIKDKNNERVNLFDNDGTSNILGDVADYLNKDISGTIILETDINLTDDVELVHIYSSGTRNYFLACLDINLNGHTINTNGHAFVNKMTGFHFIRFTGPGKIQGNGTIFSDMWASIIVGKDIQIINTSETKPAVMMIGGDFTLDYGSSIRSDNADGIVLRVGEKFMGSDGNGINLTVNGDVYAKGKAIASYTDHAYCNDEYWVNILIGESDETHKASVTSTNDVAIYTRGNNTIASHYATITGYLGCIAMKNGNYSSYTFTDYKVTMPVTPVDIESMSGDDITPDGSIFFLDSNDDYKNDFPIVVFIAGSVYETEHKLVTDVKPADGTSRVEITMGNGAFLNDVVDPFELSEGSEISFRSGFYKTDIKDIDDIPDNYTTATITVADAKEAFDMLHYGNERILYHVVRKEGLEDTVEVSTAEEFVDAIYNPNIEHIIVKEGVTQINISDYPENGANRDKIVDGKLMISRCPEEFDLNGATVSNFSMVLDENVSEKQIFLHNGTIYNGGTVLEIRGRELEADIYDISIYNTGTNAPTIIIGADEGPAASAQLYILDALINANSGEGILFNNVSETDSTTCVYLADSKIFVHHNAVHFGPKGNHSDLEICGEDSHIQSNDGDAILIENKNSRQMPTATYASSVYMDGGIVSANHGAAIKSLESDSIITLNGGKLIANNDYGIYMKTNLANSANLEIYDTSINSSKSAIKQEGKLARKWQDHYISIEGGIFSNYGDNDVVSTEQSDDVRIYAGRFSKSLDNDIYAFNAINEISGEEYYYSCLYIGGSYPYIQARGRYDKQTGKLIYKIFDMINVNDDIGADLEKLKCVVPEEELERYENGTTDTELSVVFTVDNETNTSNINQLNSAYGDTFDEYLDIGVTKIVNNDPEVLVETSEYQQIEYVNDRYYYFNLDNVVIYHRHENSDGSVVTKKMTKTTVSDPDRFSKDCYFIDGNKIVIVTKKFSTFALDETDHYIAPNEDYIPPVRRISEYVPPTTGAE